MGNWSCLYHWMEFDTPMRARSAHERLQEVGDYFAKEYDCDPGYKWAVRFGFINATTLQVVSSQKWGLEPTVAYWATSQVPCKATVQSGVDSAPMFNVIGTPTTIVPIYDELYFADWQPPQALRLPGIRGCRSANSIQLAEPVCFSLAHFNEDQLDLIGGSGKELLGAIADQFRSQNRASAGRVIFGRRGDQGSIFLGELHLEEGGSAFFETTGCYNTLTDVVTLGPYQTPLDDEPTPADVNLPQSAAMDVTT